MLHLIYFLVFNFVLFLTGRSFCILIYKFFVNKEFKDNNKIFTVPIYYFYSLLGLFFIGNVSVVFNFFSKNNSVFLKLFFFIFLLVNISKNVKINRSIINFINFFGIPSIVAISSIKIGLAYDAGLYHLNTQLWIRESNTPVGLYNLHFRYGFSSIFDYISSNFWIGDKLEILHFVNLVFIASFLSFILFNLISNQNPLLSMSSLAIVLFGILDNFGSGGGRNGFIDIESVTKQDTPFAIVFYITNILLFLSLKNKEMSKLEILLLSFLILFGIQLRIFGAVTLLLLIYTIIFIKNFQYKVLIPSTLLGIIWSLKNLLITGCFLFPVNITCIERLSWHEVGSATREMLELKSFHIGYEFGTPLSSWFYNWLEKPVNTDVIINFTFSFMFILLMFMVFTKKTTRVFDLTSRVFITFYIFVIIYLWLSTSPGIRLGIGIFLLLIGIVGLNFESFRFRNKNLKFMLALLFFISALLIPKLDNYIELLKNPTIYNKLSAPLIEYTEKDGFGVLPKNGSQCWINIECVQSDKKIMLSENSFFKTFSIRN